MYLITIHVPIYTDGPRCFVATDWKRSLLLLRDSLRERYGPVAVLAPSLPVSETGRSQQIEPLSEREDHIRPLPSFDHRCRARWYWLKERKRWRADLRRHIAECRVVHTGMGHLGRPVNFDGFLEARRLHRKPIVFFYDTDEVLKANQLLEMGVHRRRLKVHLHNLLHDRCMRYAVGAADAAMLKGRSLYQRYAPYARNVHMFHNTSYLTGEIVGDEARRRRLATLEDGRPVRLVYCGRFERRKGVDHSVRIVHEARRRGAEVELDLIGDGPGRGEIQTLVEQLGLTPHVRFLGLMTYGPRLLEKLSEYDALFFTPLGEDTPRMIFDGYAAGIPTIAYGIGYVRERRDEDGAALVLPFGQIDAAAEALAGLSRHRRPLIELSDRAHRAAFEHAAEVWYQRRAEWTVEAVERFERAASHSAGGVHGVQAASR